MNKKPSFLEVFTRILIRALIISIILVFVILNIASCQLAQSYMQPPRVSATGGTLRGDGTEFQIVELTSEDGIKLRAFYTPPQNGAVILVAHGHAGTIPEDIYSMFASHGYGVLAWEFRAHGESGGDFTSIGYYEVRDMKAALDYVLVQPGVEHIGAWGGSMGAATSIRAAANYPQIEAVVVDSSFDTLEGVFEVRVPYPVLRPFIRFYGELQAKVSLDEVRPMDEIGKLSPRSVFIIQGLADYSIPHQSAQNLFKAAGEPKYIWEGEKADHLNMYHKYPEDYEALVIDFFNDSLLLK